jgi:hypothetical protein
MAIKASRNLVGLTALLGLVLIGLAAASLARPGRAASGTEQPHTRSEFMRQKLEYAKNVLEGLSLEKYDQIEKNGRALKLLSQAAEWEVPMIPNATDYVSQTTEFQRSADELVKQAKANNIDGATLAYVRMTISCVQCHKYVRFAAQ